MKQFTINNKTYTRCTDVNEVVDRINDEALKELIGIVKREELQRKIKENVNGIPYFNWVNRYGVNPYEIEKDFISFLVKKEKVVYLLNPSKKIEKCFVAAA